MERSEQVGGNNTILKIANRLWYDPVAASTWGVGRIVRPCPDTMADLHSGREAQNGTTCRYGQLVFESVGSDGRLHYRHEERWGRPKFLQGDSLGPSKFVLWSSETCSESSREAGCGTDQSDWRILWSCLRVSFGIKTVLIDSVIVRVQMLAELEEVITYKDRMDDPERQATQRLTWQKRYV